MEQVQWDKVEAGVLRRGDRIGEETCIPWFSTCHACIRVDVAVPTDLEIPILTTCVLQVNRLFHRAESLEPS